MWEIHVPTLVNVHSHVREGEVSGPLTIMVVSGGCSIILPMPNTKDGLTTAAQVSAYINYLRSLVPPEVVVEFIPCMLVNEHTPLDELDRCAEAGIKDVKIFPLGRTTQSHNGVRHYGRIIHIVRRCGELGIRVHFHPEHPWMLIDGRDAEYMFQPLYDMFLYETEATIISEHGTDARCIPLWKEMAESKRFYVTLAPQHLATNEDAEFGDIRSICKPPIKTRRDSADLVRFVYEDHEWVMAGPDDAPHPIESKHVHEGKCACGAYHAPYILALYAHILETLLVRRLEVFIRFTSRNARKLYGLSGDSPTATLQHTPFTIPPFYKIGDWTVESFWAGRSLKWSLAKAV